MHHCDSATKATKVYELAMQLAKYAQHALRHAIANGTIITQFLTYRDKV
jgi:hypothetical protein